MSVVPRMSAEDVVTAGLRGLELGEVVCAPGVEDAGLLDAVQRGVTALIDDAEHLVVRLDTGDLWADLVDRTRGIHAEHVGIRTGIMVPSQHLCSLRSSQSRSRRHRRGDRRVARARVDR
nr:hypothetical protein [Streptomyces brasiliensis]